MQASGSPVDMATAREQHGVLVSALRGLGVDVLELAPDEGSAESVYTQDLAVVVNGIALMCRPGPHRQAEVQLVVLIVDLITHAFRYAANHCETALVTRYLPTTFFTG